MPILVVIGMLMPCIEGRTVEYRWHRNKSLNNEGNPK